MRTIFIGGSRHVSRLPAEVQERINNIVAQGDKVIVGDANGADKAVQKHLADAHYAKVTVFCSGLKARNNLAEWQTHNVPVPESAKGFQFYATKDREMAKEADFGLMIWDGKSPGTVLNVARLVAAGKISVLYNASKKATVNIKSAEDFKAFFSLCSTEIRSEVISRATPEEWESLKAEPQKPQLAADDIELLNKGLADGDVTTVLNTLGAIARDSSMVKVASKTGLSRESLYRSLGATGNPEFATVVKVLSSLGLKLEAKVAA